MSINRFGMSNLFFNQLIEDDSLNEKSRYDIAIENEVETMIDAMPPETLIDIDGKARRERMKIALLKEYNNHPINYLLEQAVDILQNEGMNYLDEKIYEQLLSDFDASCRRLESHEPSSKSSAKLQDLLQLSDSVIQAIFNVATQKFVSEQYGDCLSLYVFLATIDPFVIIYWLRLGTSAQKMGDLPLSLRAYDSVLQLDPYNLGAALLSASCHLALNNKDAARTMYFKAKEISYNRNVEAHWQHLMQALEKTLEE